MSWMIPASPPDPSMCIAASDGPMLLHWDWPLVAISVAVAIVGSFGALEFPERVRTTTEPRARRRWFFVGACLMGLAIWTMHFVGMLALRMPVPVSYRLGWSVVSMLAAAVGAGLAFWITTRPRPRRSDIFLGGVAMGVAIVSMHYLGMKSLRMPAVIDYDPTRFAASVVIAIAASVAALAMAHPGLRSVNATSWTKVGTAVLLGLAISGMHYMGMAAARYLGSNVEENRLDDPAVGSMPLRGLVELAGVVFGGTLMALAVRAATERERAIRQYERLAAELETRIQERTRELRRTNDDLVAFTDSVSHDLRGPLRTIAGFADALIDSYSDRLDETGAHYLRRIRAGATRLDELLLGLLKLSQVSRLQVRRDEINLTELAQAVVADLVAQEPTRDVEFHVAGGMTALADRALVISVLQNLLGNAWKFTRDRANARIEFAIWSAGCPVTFVIRDNGVGFDSTNAPRLFGMFERLHAPSQFHGHGVGLALTRRIIDRHGGKIWAEAAPGRGAAFFFTLEPS